MTTTDRTQRDFTLTWTLDAPPAQVFRAWTDPDHLDWYYNDRQPIPSEPIELDLRVGGVWRQMMVVDEDTSYFTGGVYREVVPGEKLVFAWGATDGWPELDLDRLDDSPLVTLTFTDVGGRTEMNLHVELPPNLVEDKPGWWAMIRSGWQDTVDRLASRIASRSSPD
jgi:uncharacterized protein YndB with AHSA1/START domain